MPVVSMVSSKGGAGKTTTALIIAGEIASAGRAVILIDADPNQPLVAWANRPGKPDNIQVVIDESAETIVDTISESKTRAHFVLVDLEGTATDRIGFAITQSDLVLIPAQGAAIREKTFRNIEAQFASAGVPVLECPLIDRAAYRSIFSFGGTIRTIDAKQVSGLPGARENAQAFVQGVLSELSKARAIA